MVHSGFDDFPVATIDCQGVKFFIVSFAFPVLEENIFENTTVAPEDEFGSTNRDLIVAYQGDIMHVGLGEASQQWFPMLIHIFNGWLLRLDASCKAFLNKDVRSVGGGEGLLSLGTVVGSMVTPEEAMLRRRGTEATRLALRKMERFRLPLPLPVKLELRRWAVDDDRIALAGRMVALRDDPG
ncbi:hypothetical protein ACHAXS_013493 [Conticribra weissflogii]